MKLSESDLRLKAWAGPAAEGPLINPRAVEALELLAWKELLPEVPTDTLILAEDNLKLRKEVMRLRSIINNRRDD